MDSKRTTGKEKNMMLGFKKFMNLQADKKCPPGYRFDTKLKVCVPIGQRGYVSYYGLGSGRNGGDTTPSPAPGNGNGNGNGGNGNGGNGGNGGGE